MPTRTIFLTGGGGFVGSSVIDVLLDRGHNVRALVTSKPLDRRGDRVVSIPGGLFNAPAMDSAMAGCDAAVHLVGVIAERPGKGATYQHIHVDGTAAVIAAAGRAGVRRMFHMSALGARPNAPAAYHATKFAAEELVRASGLDWTIFRPSMIHGPRGQFTQQMAGWARALRMPYLFMPYFGRGLFGRGGSGLIQPVLVNDIARAIVESIDRPETFGELYPVGGADRITWPQMYRIVAEAVIHRHRVTLPIPIWYANAVASMMPGGLLPFNKSQVQMAAEDNVCDPAKFAAAFGSVPMGFTAALATYCTSL